MVGVIFKIVYKYTINVNMALDYVLEKGVEQQPGNYLLFNVSFI